MRTIRTLQELAAPVVVRLGCPLTPWQQSRLDVAWLAHLRSTTRPISEQEWLKLRRGWAAAHHLACTSRIAAVERLTAIGSPRCSIACWMDATIHCEIGLAWRTEPIPQGAVRPEAWTRGGSVRSLCELVELVEAFRVVLEQLRALFAGGGVVHSHIYDRRRRTAHFRELATGLVEILHAVLPRSDPRRGRAVGSVANPYKHSSHK